MDNITEQALLLGPRKSLVGVISSAAAAVQQPQAPFVVILNAGIIHRVGPHRLHVNLARTLSAAGYNVLRFDLSGIGDSEARADGLPPLDAAMADVREVLDMLEATRQVRRVVLVGLCSGADHSVIYAGSDPRVVGVVLLDPSIPRTPLYYLNHYGRRMLRLRPWLNVALGRHVLWPAMKRLLSRAPANPVPQDQTPALENPAVRAFLQDAYRRALDNDIRFMAVLTAGAEQRHNHRRQMLDAFPQVPFGERLQLEYFKDSDHTFTLERNRARVIRMIAQWLGEAPFRAAPEPKQG